MIRLPIMVQQLVTRFAPYEVGVRAEHRVFSPCRGLLVTEEQIKKILMDVSPNTGQPVYIGDFANVERRYQDPDAVARFDGEASVLLSVEMQKGRNIVDLGEQISAALARVRPLLPPDLKLDLIADQPSAQDQPYTQRYRTITN